MDVFVALVNIAFFYFLSIYLFIYLFYFLFFQEVCVCNGIERSCL